MFRMPETSRNLPDPANDTVPGRRLAAPEERAHSALMAAANAYVEARGGDQGHFQTAIDGVIILRSFQEMERRYRLYNPALCVVIQGAKQIQFGDEVLDYKTMQCLVVSVQLPAGGRIVEASNDDPFLSITIDFDVATLREVMAQMDLPQVKASDAGPRPFVADVDESLADCILRLIRMLDTPKAIPILYPSVMREICYWLLSGSHGAELRQLALPETHTERLVNAIYFLRANYTQTLRVEELAETARMSASSFHQHFKALTSMTPLQYQKQLRLLEARRLMVASGANVADAAYQVGYESASQFSREYSRMFGVAPKRDAMSLKALAAYMR